jgi:hypothetical protein
VPCRCRSTSRETARGLAGSHCGLLRIRGPTRGQLSCWRPSLVKTRSNGSDEGNIKNLVAMRASLPWIGWRVYPERGTCTFCSTSMDPMRASHDVIFNAEKDCISLPCDCTMSRLLDQFNFTTCSEHHLHALKFWFSISKISPPALLHFIQSSHPT